MASDRDIALEYLHLEFSKGAGHIWKSARKVLWSESAKDAIEWQGTLVTLVWNAARQTITVEDNFCSYAGVTLPLSEFLLEIGQN